MSIEKNEIDYLADAIKSLDPDAQFSVRDTDLSDINWITTPIAQSEIDAEVVRLKALWTAQEYARNRKLEYPDWGTQLNKIYDDGVTKWKSEMVDPVKAKWPKDNSGPK